MNLRDLSDWKHRLRIHCRSCYVDINMTPSEMRGKVPTYLQILPIENVDKYLKCSSCGQKNANIHIEDVAGII